MAEEIRLSRRNSRAASRRPSNVGSPSAGTPPGSNPVSRKNSFANELTKKLAFTGLSKTTPIDTRRSTTDGPETKLSPEQSSSPVTYEEDPFEDDTDDEIDIDNLPVDTSDLVDRSVKILPGVRRMIDSIPEGRYAVATSGATTYCYGALSRVGITPPEITITADDPRLKRGKPFPDPFILAAEQLGYDPKNCLVVEDSPSGIRAGVAAGGKVIVVCTSHPFEKIKDCGSSYIVPDLEYVTIKTMKDGRLKITIDPNPLQHEVNIATSKARDDLAEKLKNMKIGANAVAEKIKADAAAASA